MSIEKKILKPIINGFKTNKSKNGIEIWRFIFNAIEESTSREQMFFVEVEFLNPNSINQNPVLGFKPRVKIKEEDLQFVLAGSDSAKSLETESIVLPSYCVVRIGKIGNSPSQICEYYSLKNCSSKKNPFELRVGNCIFTQDSITGNIIVDPESLDKHPEFMCNSGTSSWNLKYNLEKIFLTGCENKNVKWFPCGAISKISGTLDYDNLRYKVIDRLSYGYVERYSGKILPSKWFHISSNNLTSNINGNNLFESTFVVQGIFDDKIAFLGSFEGLDVNFNIKASKTKYFCVWDCVQTPENGEERTPSLHWSVSVHNKEFVIDVDVYCNIKDLFNRKLEMPEGNRKILSILEGFTGTGEIKVYKKIGKTLEQIEYAKIEKAVCEFGDVELIE